MWFKDHQYLFSFSLYINTSAQKGQSEALIQCHCFLCAFREFKMKAYSSVTKKKNGL